MFDARGGGSMRPNAPKNSTRGPDTETARLFSLAAWSKIDTEEPYFAAVGSGFGLSERLFR
jgi:hypothetical protein